MVAIWCMGNTYLWLGVSVEEPGEQCTVVFALIVTGPVVSVVVWGVYCIPPPPPPSGFVTIYTKTTVHCSPDSSMGVSH
jgi:hypothetical protein